MESDNVVEELTCKVWGSVCGLGWNEVSHLAEPVNDDKDGVVATRGRELGDVIHRD